MESLVSGYRDRRATLFGSGSMLEVLGHDDDPLGFRVEGLGHLN